MFAAPQYVAKYPRVSTSKVSALAQGCDNEKNFSEEKKNFSDKDKKKNFSGNEKNFSVDRNKYRFKYRFNFKFTVAKYPTVWKGNMTAEG